MNTPCPQGQRLALNQRGEATIQYCVSMTDGRADGAYRCSYPGGAGVSGSFSRNRKVGEWHFRHAGGELLRVEHWVDGHLERTELRVDDERPPLACGQEIIVAARESLPDLNRGWRVPATGVARRPFPDSDTIWMEGAYRNGLKHGEWRYRGRNGRLRFRGHFADGLPDGRWEALDARGRIIRSGRYAHGVLRRGEPIVREAASVRGAISEDPAELSRREVRRSLEEARR